MQNPVLLSTALLTMLLSVGLFFFIRASAKDRTQIVQFLTEQQEEPLFEQLQTYFTDRSYRLIAVDVEQNQIKYEGFVRPSLFLAIFLTFLAAIGVFCLSLVLSFLFPSAANVLPALVLISPIAGFFYWRKAGRPEQVSLRVETLSPSSAQAKSLLTVTAHRDEVLAMRRSLNLQEFEAAE
ncbi:cofactor assembly of complex C subunit B [filamentous cyanobacterium CCP2]|nr:cofactor assembly of complex C subunit B [filamentous cyanobacterium CCP2]